MRFTSSFEAKSAFTWTAGIWYYCHFKQQLAECQELFFISSLPSSLWRQWRWCLHAILSLQTSTTSFICTFTSCMEICVLIGSWVCVLLLLFQLETGPHSAAYNLLQLFAYGTYSTYKGMSIFIADLSVVSGHSVLLLTFLHFYFHLIISGCSASYHQTLSHVQWWPRLRKLGWNFFGHFHLKFVAQNKKKFNMILDKLVTFPHNLWNATRYCP